MLGVFVLPGPWYGAGMKMLTPLFLGLALFIAPVFVEAAGKDKTPPSLTSIHIQSTNTNPAQAKAGDMVTITFVASEKVTPVVLVETKVLLVRARNTSGNSWEASYTVNSKDPKGKVDYLITLVDTAKNVSVCSSIRTSFLKYCPTTDGSSVTIYKEVVPVPDTTAPVIALHATVFATTTDTSAVVSYDLPTATDNINGAVAVSCAPASGSVFALGTTPVVCSASDAAGNQGTNSFDVIVTQEVVVPPADTTAPVIATHADVTGTTTEGSAAVSYDLPTAFDEHDGVVAVSCTPTSGSVFSLGTTTVLCSAADSAGNQATSSFAVVMTQILPPDTTPPAVVSFSPGMGSTTVATNAPIVVVFDEPLAAASVTIDTVQFWQDALVTDDTFEPAIRFDGSVTLSEDGTTVTITPGAELAPGRAYYVVVPGGIPTTITDLSGNQPSINLLDATNGRFQTVF